MEVPDENMQRFTVELEFVQCLANPEYLNCTFLLRFYYYFRSRSQVFMPRDSDSLILIAHARN